ncbi:hypothetical protein [Cytobacillus horneckiae]|uniref:hypothetical protein n=1 Tax=Cytobacillus horneckiae TaxID=549687 RepID=UPI003D9A454F
MKTGICLLLSSTFLSICLAGCLPREPFTIESNVNPIFESNSRLINIHISNLKADDTLIIDDKESLNTLQTIFSSVMKVEGIVNMTDPGYSLSVQYDDKKQHDFYLWIGEKDKTITLMKTDDTQTVYTVIIKETNQLIDMMESVIE